MTHGIAGRDLDRCSVGVGGERRWRREPSDGSDAVEDLACNGGCTVIEQHHRGEVLVFGHERRIVLDGIAPEVLIWRFTESDVAYMFGDVTVIGRVLTGFVLAAPRERKNNDLCRPRTSPDRTGGSDASDENGAL